MTPTGSARASGTLALECVTLAPPTPAADPSAPLAASLALRPERRVIL